MIYIKKDTATTVMIGPFVDSTDGFTAETALDLTSATIHISKNAGAWGLADASATHTSGGFYTVPLDATDCNTLGRLQLYVNETGALPVFHDYQVVRADVFDTLFATDYLQVDVIQWASSAAATGTFANVAATNPCYISSGTGAGQINFSTGGLPGVNVVQLGGTAQTGRDIGANVLISSGTGAGQIDFSSGGIPKVDAVQLGGTAQTGRDIGASVLISSGTGTGQLINTAGVVTANVTFWNSTAVAANSLANVTALASGNFTTGCREFLWANVGADSGVSNTLMLERIYSILANRVTITDSSGDIVIRNAADDGDLATGKVTDDASDTVRTSMTWT
jgi:hypothetical protein